MSRTLLRMKAVPSNAAFCKQLKTMGIQTMFRWFSISSLTVPKAPTAIGITVALTSHNFWFCNLKPGIWWFFLAPSLWCFDLQMSTIFHSLFSLSITAISFLRCSISLSVWIAKSQSILHLSFSTTAFGSCQNHLSLFTLLIFQGFYSGIFWKITLNSFSFFLACKLYKLAL